MSISSPPVKRPIRSYILRQGRITPGQERAYKDYWSQFGIEQDQLADNLQIAFDKRQPLFLEIGFGNGDALAETASLNPGNNYLGVEVHSPGVGHLLLQLAQQGLRNVRIVQCDAMDLLRNQMPAGCLAGVMLFFPDPWPKKRHHKRRIVQAEFVRLAHQALLPGGTLHIATDWKDYAFQIKKLISPRTGFQKVSESSSTRENLLIRPETKFERRGRRLGHDIWDLLYRRQE